MQGSRSPYYGRGLRITDLSFTALNSYLSVPDDLVPLTACNIQGHLQLQADLYLTPVTASWLDQSEQRRSSFRGDLRMRSSRLYGLNLAFILGLTNPGSPAELYEDRANLCRLKLL